MKTIPLFLSLLPPQLSVIALLSVALVFDSLWNNVLPAQAADVPCTTLPENLTRNGSLTEGGYETPYGLVANWWNLFRISGEWPSFALHDAENANGDLRDSSSQFINANDIVFDVGLYQEVTGTQPGTWYQFSVGWAPMLRDLPGGRVNQRIDDVVMRQVGADPFGGTDPTASTIVWGPEFWHGSQGLNPESMIVTFKAMSERVTLFIRVRNLDESPSDKVFLDVMCLVPRTDIPAETPSPSPTLTAEATQAPPTLSPPTRVPATSIPPTVTSIPPSPLPAQVWTITPQAIAKNVEKQPPEQRQRIPRAVSGDASQLNDQAILSPLLLLGLLGMAGMGLLLILLVLGFVVWRVFFRQVDHALDPDS